MRFGGTHRCWWDYDGGGLADMGQHYTDPMQWQYGKDDTSPVLVEAHAPPAHLEATGMWGWVELTYADGFTVVFDSGEWGLTFVQAVRQRKQSAGHPESSHRSVTLLHLANIAIRLGRKIRYDPVAEQVIGDEEANRLVNQPMRAPWHL